MTIDPLDCGLDELHQLTMTPREKKIKAHFHKPKAPSGGKKSNGGWIVYNTRDNNNDHISVSANNPDVFHASVGNQRYGDGYNRQGNLTFFDHSQGRRPNQSDWNFAVQLYQFWSTL